MNQKIFFLILFIVLGIFLIGFIQNKNNESEQEKEAVSYHQESLEMMVLLENKMALENESKRESTEDENLPDYSKLFPELYVKTYLQTPSQLKEKTVYLTFDDGPSDNTLKILKILEEKNVKATFFVVGNSITEDNEEYLKVMMEQGEVIGIHTYSHNCNDIYCSVECYLEDFNRAYEKIYAVTGEKISIFRFPWGSENKYNERIEDVLKDEMVRRGFVYYDWNVSAEDSVGRVTAYSIKKNILKDLERYDTPIILMHDSINNDITVDTLPEVIDIIREKGYVFDTLDHREPYEFEWSANEP